MYRFVYKSFYLLSSDSRGEKCLEDCLRCLMGLGVGVSHIRGEGERGVSSLFCGLVVEIFYPFRRHACLLQRFRMLP